MKSNYDELIKQFIDASGIKHVDLKSKSFLEDFSNWLKERKAMGEKYVAIISELGAFKDSLQCAEVNKGVEDSVTLPYHTKLLTPYIDKSMVDESERLITANFSIDTKRVMPFISTDEVKMASISNDAIRTYMTQNPYDARMLDGWDLLHNSRRSNVVVGLYGNESDKDRSKKKDMLMRFRHQLVNNFREVECVLNGEYFCFVGSKQNKR